MIPDDPLVHPQTRYGGDGVIDRRPSGEARGEHIGVDDHRLARACVPQLERVRMTGDSLGPHLRLGLVEDDTGEHDPDRRKGDYRDLHGRMLSRTRLASMVPTTRAGAWMVAEADGNRTRQGPVRPLTGFEDRGTHQASGRLHGD